MKNTYPRIKLYKRRGFDATMNAAFAMLRQHARPILMVQLRVTGPIALAYLMVSFFLSIGTLGASTGLGGNQMSATDYSFWFFLSSLLQALVSLMVSLSIFAYIKIYNHREDDHIPVSDVWAEVRRYLLPAIGVSILYGISVAIGFFLLLIPGIYMAVRFSMALPAVAFKNLGSLEALSYSSNLTREYWWRTFGLLLLFLIFSLMVRVVFSLPGSIFIGAEAFLSISETDDPSQFELPKWSLLIHAILELAGNILALIILYMGISFHFGALVEAKESTGLMDEIENLDANADGG